MKYRTIRVAGGEDRVSMLGFGTMRFPVNEEGAIDEPEAERLMDRAIAAGVNYIDTAYPYHSETSEPFVGKVLAKYPRDKFFLATKLPVWKVESLEDAERLFHEQLGRLHVKYVDYYLLHALDKGRWDKMVKLGVVRWAEEMKKEGKIRRLGFSFHDSYEVFREILTYRQWDFCQIQYNYMDRNIQAGDKGYALAEKMGVPVIVMEPVKGGRLASLPAEAEEILREADPEASMASWAMKWVGSHPDVKVILSGMSSMEQVEDNLKTFENFRPLNREALECVERAAKAIRSKVKNGCTGCRYCMPCPFGVDIPGNFSIWNDLAMYGNREQTEKSYQKKKEEKTSADICRQCGHCEQACPQSLHIREDLKAVAEEFGS
ncbi:MAG: aldo/keto reductase [Enterocloster sp.]